MVDRASHACEIFIALLVVANVVAIILESVHSIHEEFELYFHYFDLVSVMVFSFEYVMRVWSYREKYHGPNDSPWRGRKEYIFSAFGLVDFFSTVPFYLQLLFPGADLRVLRMFRLMRIFKLSRYNSAMEDMLEAIKSEWDSFSSALFLLFISCLLFSSLIYIIEGHDQPEIFIENKPSDTGISKRWTFDKYGAIVFPDETQQTTAYRNVPLQQLNLDGGAASAIFDINMMFVDGGGSYRRGYSEEYNGGTDTSNSATFTNTLDGGQS